MLNQFESSKYSFFFTICFNFPLDNSISTNYFFYYRQFLAYANSLKLNSINLPTNAFIERQQYYSEQFKNGRYLKNPEAAGKAPSLTDASAMDGMIAMVKGQAMNFVPQTLMMSWISTLFSGFVLMRLPFPLTVRFKSMLQSGVVTNDLDVRWVSAVSWYVLNLIGLQSVFSLILGRENSKFFLFKKLFKCDFFFLLVF